MIRNVSSLTGLRGLKEHMPIKPMPSSWSLDGMSSNAKTVFISSLIFFLSCSVVGCSATQKTTTTARSTWEQLLLSQSLQRSLSSATMPLKPGVSVGVEAVGLTGDKDFARGLVIRVVARKGATCWSRGSHLPHTHYSSRIRN